MKTGTGRQEGHDPLERLRTICLALPGATEKLTWGEHPTFRVRDKIFAMAGVSEQGTTMNCKAAPGAQDVLVRSDPAHFFVPPYVGRNGWIGIRLDEDLDWEIVADLVEESYRMTAPKRLLAILDRG